MGKKKSNGNNGKLATDDASTSLTTTAEVVDMSKIAPDPMTFIEDITTKSLEGISIERVVTLDPGKMIRGKYLGMGAVMEVSDPVTGEVRELGTHRIEVRDGLVARLMSSHQLDRELPPLMHKRVRVMKLGQVSTRKGRRVNDFIVAPETV